jgi:hypothetical protein
MTAESARGHRCPVCDGHVERGRPRCVRCESDLEMWWPLEEAIRRVDEPAAPGVEHRPAPVPGLARYVPIVVVAIVCAATGGSVTYLATTPALGGASLKVQVLTAPQQPLAIDDAPPTTAPVTRSADDLVYYVQRGDTWWRLAARFTGHGRNWRALEAASNHVPLRSGGVLRLDRAALPGY